MVPVQREPGPILPVRVGGMEICGQLLACTVGTGEYAARGPWEALSHFPGTADQGGID